MPSSSLVLFSPGRRQRHSVRHGPGQRRLRAALRPRPGRLSRILQDGRQDQVLFSHATLLTVITA